MHLLECFVLALLLLQSGDVALVLVNVFLHTPGSGTVDVHECTGSAHSVPAYRQCSLDLFVPRLTHGECTVRGRTRLKRK
jgi:hypothetical protein